MHQVDRLMVKYIKLAGGQEYPYIEFPVTQQEAIHGFYIEILANKLQLAVTPTDLLLGLREMDPVAETAANTIYSVNTGAAAKRIIGDIDLNFTALLMNRVMIRPSLAVDGVTPPALLPPIFGMYLRTDGLKLVMVYKSKGDI